jgi:hypothetical protein
VRRSTIDTPEEIKPTPIVIVEGLHPWYDKRVKDLLDFTIYLDISDEIKQAWKIQRDMAERGWTLDQVKEEIMKRKPDFDKVADAVIQVLPTQLTNDPDGKFLRVRLIQKDGELIAWSWLMRGGSAQLKHPPPSLPPHRLHGARVHVRPGLDHQLGAVRQEADLQLPRHQVRLGPRPLVQPGREYLSLEASPPCPSVALGASTLELGLRTKIAFPLHCDLYLPGERGGDGRRVRQPGGAVLH